MSDIDYTLFKEELTVAINSILNDDKIVSLVKNTNQPIRRIAGLDLYLDGRIVGTNSPAPDTHRRIRYMLPEFHIHMFKGMGVWLVPITGGTFQSDQEHNIDMIRYSIVTGHGGDNKTIGEICRRPRRTLHFYLRPRSSIEKMVHNMIINKAAEAAPDTRIYYGPDKAPQKDI